MIISTMNSLKSSLDSSSVDDFIAALERFDELRSVLSYIEGEGGTVSRCAVRNVFSHKRYFDRGICGTRRILY